MEKRKIFAIVLAVIFLISVIPLAELPTASSTKIEPKAMPITKIDKELMQKIQDAISSNQPNKLLPTIIQTVTKNYDDLISAINDADGVVTHTFKYANGLAAKIPAKNILKIAENELIQKIYYDVEWTLSSNPNLNVNIFDTIKEQALSLSEKYQTIFVTPEILKDLKTLNPNTYWNPTAMGATPVWSEGYRGQGSLIVIIDTGIYSGHPMFRGTSIIGGVDLSDDVGTQFEGWDSPTNHWHGSHVAGIIASTGGIIVPPDDPLALAIERYTGQPLPPGDPYGYPGTKVIWLLGMAPLADLYIIKIFDHTGAGVTESKVIEAIEYAISLKLEQGLDVDVISMSLSGPTLFDGRDLEDQVVDFATSIGITIVAAAGNEGPAPMTTGSPGTANTAITVAAVANPANTRVFWDIYYDWPGLGYYLFTSETPQVIYFSSRGPTADGRLKPTISATGVFVLSAYHNVTEGIYEGYAFASGTSMATPAVSGAIALLNSYAEANFGNDVASPEDYRQAITKGAIWLDGYTAWDQGAGYLNAYNALEALKADESLGDVAPELSPVAQLAPIANIPIYGEGKYKTYIKDLKPGHKVEFIFYVSHLTYMIKLDLRKVYLGDENLLGLNSFEVYIQSAKRSTYAYYVDSANVWGPATFIITDYETKWFGRVSGVFTDPWTRLAPIEPGYVKIVIENDWTSYDEISAEIVITVKAAKKVRCPDYVQGGFIGPDEVVDWIPIEVPEGARKAEILLMWLNDWSTYPTSDLDLYVCWDEGYVFDGTTLNSPERVILERPTYIYILIHGYAIYTEYPEMYILLIWFW